MKKKTKLTRKQVITYIVVTIILGALLYLISSSITKMVLDKKASEEQTKKNLDLIDVTNPDPIEKVSLDSLITNYNELLAKHDLASYQLKEVTSEDTIKTYQTDKIEVSFQTDLEENVLISAITYPKKDDLSKTLITYLIMANNASISKESIDLIYKRVHETKENTEDDTSYTSEFFQYQGLEFSLKTTKNKNDQTFRIGRIYEAENN